MYIVSIYIFNIYNVYMKITIAVDCDIFFDVSRTLDIVEHFQIKNAILKLFKE